MSLCSKFSAMGGHDQCVKPQNEVQWEAKTSVLNTDMCHGRQIGEFIKQEGPKGPGSLTSGAIYRGLLMFSTQC